MQLIPLVLFHIHIQFVYVACEFYDASTPQLIKSLQIIIQLFIVNP